MAYCALPHGTPISDVVAAVDTALALPLEYPPLAQSVLPGDKVALALADGVPRAATVVGRTVAALLAGGVSPTDITLVRAPCDSGAQVLSDAALLSESPEPIACVTHNPADRSAQSYLAASVNAPRSTWLARCTKPIW